MTDEETIRDLYKEYYQIEEILKSNKEFSDETISIILTIVLKTRMQNCKIPLIANTRFDKLNIKED